MTDPTDPTVPTEVLPLGPSGNLPMLGFGTWQRIGHGAYDAVRAALDVGLPKSAKPERITPDAGLGGWSLSAEEVARVSGRRR